MNQNNHKIENITPILTIIVCAFNEINLIERAINELEDFINSQKYDIEVIILDNGSTDGTREWLNQFKNSKFKIALNEKNLGKGGSIKKGIYLSKGKYIVIHDPDLEYRANDIWKLLEKAQQTNSTFVLGSRILTNKPQYRYLRTYLGVLFLTWVIRGLYGIKISDSATALKLIKGDFARKLNLASNGFDLDFELITRTARLGGRFNEVGVDYTPRTFEGGKKLKPFKDGILSLLAIIRDRFLSKQTLLNLTDTDLPQKN